MSFFGMVLKNLRRRPGRSILTATGVAIGIAAVLILISIAWGFEKTWASGYDASGADLLVGKLSTRRPLPTPFSASTAEELAKLPDVGEAAGVLSDLLGIEDAPALVIFGWESKSFLWNHLSLIEGRWPADDRETTVALGSVAAEILGKAIGDRVQVEDTEFTVCGKFSSQAISENGAVVMTLHQLQKVTGRDGMINFVTLKLRPGAGLEGAARVRSEIRDRFRGFSAETSGEVVRRNIAVQAAKAMSLATSLVALLIGAVGITNTVLMSVLERLHEIAVLLALGWRRSRILKMILIESTALSFLGGIAGIVIGILGMRSLQAAPWFRGKIEMDAGPLLILSVLVTSVALGAVCGLYPAWRGTRIPVVEGLRHE